MSSTPFSLRKIAVPAFGPSLLFGLGEGAILPVIALSAREVGASVAVAGLIVALIGIGSLLNNLPAAMVTSRFGERRSMIGAAAFSVLALVLCVLATDAWVLALGVLMIGMAASVFLLARQTYLIDAVPISMRARAMSTLGGTMRIGLFIGPFAGAAFMHFLGLAGAYWAAIVAMVSAGALSFAIPELEVRRQPGTPRRAKPTMLSIARDYHIIFLTLGTGILLVSALRASRQIVIPLWADHLGLGPATISIIYGLVAAIDMLVFYPAGKMMDKRGRLSVALPSTLIMGLSLVFIPLTTGLFSFALVAMVMGFGNGISSGFIMTLGADASPVVGRTEFLGIWRLISDLGSSGGPLLLSGVTALVSLSAGIVAIGLLGFAAAGVFWRWTPRTLTN